jgi:hypothetical protein
LAAFGGRAAQDIVTRDVNDLLTPKMSSAGRSPRTVNKHRQVISAIYGYGCQEATSGTSRAFGDGARASPAESAVLVGAALRPGG